MKRTSDRYRTKKKTNSIDAQAHTRLGEFLLNLDISSNIPGSRRFFEILKLNGLKLLYTSSSCAQFNYA